MRLVVSADPLGTVILAVGVIYSLVTSRALFFQIFSEKSPHRRTHTVKGWSVWLAIVTGGWILAFVIGESIPFFNECVCRTDWSQRAVADTCPVCLQPAIPHLVAFRQLVWVRSRRTSPSEGES